MYTVASNGDGNNTSSESSNMAAAPLFVLYTLSTSCWIAQYVQQQSMAPLIGERENVPAYSYYLVGSLAAFLPS